VPGPGTLLAVAEDLHPTAGDVEAMLAGQSLVDGTAMTTLELDNFSAGEANQVLMFMGLRLIARVVAGQLKLANQVQVLQQLQGPIDGRQAEAGDVSASELIYLIGAQMPGVLPYDSHDGPSLRREAVTSFPK
jgi:hypothetical protein